MINIGIKVPDMEWETTGRNVRPQASNENPAKMAAKCMAKINTLSNI